MLFRPRLLLLACLSSAAGCKLQSDIKTHPDVKPMTHDASGTGHHDAGHDPMHDAGDPDASMDASTVPGAPFKDDFTRPDGAIGPEWKDTGPGTPRLWNGELCIVKDGRATAQFPRAQYGYVQLDVQVSAGFELHLADEEDFLVLRWFDDNTIGTSQEGDLQAGPVKHIAIELDYAQQVAAVTFDQAKPQTLAFSNPKSHVDALAALYVFDAYVQPPEIPIGLEYPGPDMCIDNVFVAAARPDVDPFASSPPIPACYPSTEPIIDCVSRHCCDENNACEQGNKNCDNEMECLYSCVLQDPSGTIGSCTQFDCNVTNPLSVALGNCVDTYCTRDKLGIPDPDAGSDGGYVVGYDAGDTRDAGAP